MGSVVCAASIDSMMVPAIFPTRFQLRLKVSSPQSSRCPLVSWKRALKHAGLGDINREKFLLKNAGSISAAAFSSITKQNIYTTCGRSKKEVACRHLYSVASSYGSPEENSSSLPSEELEPKIDLNLPRRRLQVSFTCDACGERSQRLINPHAYARGTVFVQCAGCEVYHQLVDNLGLIEEYDFRLETDPKVDGSEA